MTQGVTTAINPEAVDAARAAVPPAEVLALFVETFDALADPTRARILHALQPGELCVRDLALAVGASESAVSHQLRLLRDRRLVKPQRDGTTIYYTIDDQHLAALFREAGYHVDHVRIRWPHPIWSARLSRSSWLARRKCVPSHAWYHAVLQPDWSSEPGAAGSNRTSRACNVLGFRKPRPDLWLTTGSQAARERPDMRRHGPG